MPPSSKNAEKIVKLPTILTLAYGATTKGWDEFSIDATLADAVGYDLITVNPLGTQSFGAVWKMVRQSKHNPDLGVEDDEFSLADEGDL